jgi:hypothetical protein
VLTSDVQFFFCSPLMQNDFGALLNNFYTFHFLSERAVKVNFRTLIPMYTVTCRAVRVTRMTGSCSDGFISTLVTTSLNDTGVVGSNPTQGMDVCVW